MNAEPREFAAPLRARREAAALWLSQRSLRADVAWPDLTALPAWALADAEHLDALAVHTGAWRHADTLRRCIDGRTRRALRALLGQHAFQVLMADDAAPSAPELPGDWPLWLRDEGRGCLLASIERPRLRLALHRTLWPALTDSPPPGLQPADALSLVQRASTCLPLDLSVSDGSEA
jgi:hypothetical protein